MNSIRMRILVKNLLFGVLALCFSATPARSQDQGETPAAGDRVFPGPGEQADLPDTLELKCAIVEWQADAPTPKLTIVCPPREVFTPLRVYLQFSWAKPEQVPPDYRDIVAPPNMQTKMRSNKKAAFLWLKVHRKDKGKPQVKWVSFNYILGMALQPVSSTQ
jgi:hypothetical protein